MVFVPFAVFLFAFFHRTELVGLTKCQARIWGFYMVAIKGLSLRASQFSTFSNLKVWSQTQIRVIFEAKDTEAFNTVKYSLFDP